MVCERSPSVDCFVPLLLVAYSQYYMVFKRTKDSNRVMVQTGNRENQDQASTSVPVVASHDAVSSAVAMRPVESGHIAAIGYDERTQTLTVKFKNGAVHQYRNVPVAKYEELMAAESHGAHFNQHIRAKEEHPSRRIDQ